MTAFILVLICYFISLVFHMILHRVMKKYSVIAYLFGLLALLYLIRIGHVSLPVPSSVLYVLFSCLTVLFYIALTLGTELPSSIILASFKRNPEQNETTLTSLFSDRGLILNRVDDLRTSGLVTQTGKTMRLTQGGRCVWEVMKLYRVLFHRYQTE